MKGKDKPSILFIASHQFAAKFYRGQLRWFKSHGFKVALLASPGEELDLAGQEEDVETIGIPFQLSKTPGAVRRVYPELGQHTEEILLEFGYTWDDIVKLKGQKAIT